jgi:hypothetical protein
MGLAFQPGYFTIYFTDYFNQPVSAGASAAGGGGDDLTPEQLRRFEALVRARDAWNATQAAWRDFAGRRADALAERRTARIAAVRARSLLEQEATESAAQGLLDAVERQRQANIALLALRKEGLAIRKRFDRIKRDRKAAREFMALIMNLERPLAHSEEELARAFMLMMMNS